MGEAEEYGAEEGEEGGVLEVGVDYPANQRPIYNLNA